MTQVESGLPSDPKARCPSDGQLLEGLASRDEQARSRARAWAVKLGKAVVPALIEAARGTNADLRWEAVDNLGAIRDRRAIPVVLERVLEDDDVHVRWRSIWAISSLDDGSVGSRLVEALASPDSDISWNAAVALSVLERPEAIPRLRAGLQSPAPFRRWEAVNGLGSVYDGETARDLEKVLSEEQNDLRREAALSLGRIGDPASVRPLLKALGEDDDPQVRWRAAMSLGRLGDPSILPELARHLEHEPDESVRTELEDAIQALSCHPGFTGELRG